MSAPPAPAHSRSGALRVLIAPDSFKGSADATEVAAALAEGWRRERGDDELIVLPQADGGEGTAEAISAAVPGAVWYDAGPVPGPDGAPVAGRWLQLPDGTAVVELAQMCGLPLLRSSDPTGATTRGLGDVVRAAIEAGARAVCITLGGSASTDGGAGALTGLGARLLDRHGQPVPAGGTALAQLHRVDVRDLVPPPPDGVELLVDTRAVLTGPSGAAHVFGPQKGATPAQVAELDAALTHYARVLGTVLHADPRQPGSGAAGGSGFGLAAWGGCIVDGATRIADLTGLATILPTCDVVVTGEGCYDRTSATGKLVGALLERADRHGVASVVVAGRLDAAPPGLGVDLSRLAGSGRAAMDDPTRWLRRAGTDAARRTSTGRKAANTPQPASDTPAEPPALAVRTTHAQRDQ
ncbi:glycerate kinase [Streptomyces sp. TG1A-8]|uniref:glycerate kinase n=1 Tax=Streptomyces sp. TG1A-8 TaxID=3051385 RepID=UPI00265C4634|nr:glycerate kinase [Streptomyces sp. TG1A-8]MDO0929592.1 glycerate kinase [Streptomyces sp. TG1A-8]